MANRNPILIQSLEQVRPNAMTPTQRKAFYKQLVYPAIEDNDFIRNLKDLVVSIHNKYPHILGFNYHNININNLDNMNTQMRNAVILSYRNYYNFLIDNLVNASLL